jgi:hypothetical protein
MSRPRIDDGKRVPMSTRVSEDLAARIDATCGLMPVAQTWRQADACATSQDAASQCRSRTCAGCAVLNAAPARAPRSPQCRRAGRPSSTFAPRARGSLRTRSATRRELGSHTFGGSPPPRPATGVLAEEVLRPRQDEIVNVVSLGD